MTTTFPLPPVLAVGWHAARMGAATAIAARAPAPISTLRRVVPGIGPSFPGALACARAGCDRSRTCVLAIVKWRLGSQRLEFGREGRPHPGRRAPRAGFAP